MHIEDGVVDLESSDWGVVEYYASVQCPHCKKWITIYSTEAYFHSKFFKCDECGKSFEVNSAIF